MVTNNNFLLTISICCQEKWLWEIIKWSVKRKCSDLLSNSQLILKGNVWRSVWRIYMGILGLKGLKETALLKSTHYESIFLFSPPSGVNSFLVSNFSLLAGLANDQQKVLQYRACDQAVSSVSYSSSIFTIRLWVYWAFNRLYLLKNMTPRTNRTRPAITATTIPAIIPAESFPLLCAWTFGVSAKWNTIVH